VYLSAPCVWVFLPKLDAPDQLREQERQRAEQERQRAEQAEAQAQQSQRAEQAEAQLEALRALLREKGINPEQL
ncbi:hypothetical protein NIES2101_43525, partial [Calothrix sp. HK-06]